MTGAGGASSSTAGTGGTATSSGDGGTTDGGGVEDGGAPTPIDSADILWAMRPNRPFSGQSNFYHTGASQTVLTGAVAYIKDPTVSKYTNTDMTAWNDSN